MLSTPVTVVKV